MQSKTEKKYLKQIQLIRKEMGMKKGQKEGKGQNRH